MKENKDVNKKLYVYVGVDIPEHIKNIKVADNDSSVKITWDKVGNTGVIGGLVIADNVDYEVWNTASYNGTMLLGEKLSTIHMVLRQIFHLILMKENKVLHIGQ